MRSIDAEFAGLSLVGWLLVAPIGAWAQPNCIKMQVPVASIGGQPDAYAEFCMQYDGACDLKGAYVLEWSVDVQAVLERVNSDVNQETDLVSDWEASGLDDEWDYPFQCRGDCEDFALEKRRRLVAVGFPSAALTMAIAFQEVEFFSHAVLLVETDHGTLMLDSRYDTVLCWDDAPYIFTHREHPDGSWLRFKLP